MTSLFTRPWVFVVIAALSAIAMLALAACGDDADAGDSPSGDAVVLSAISILDNAGFHEIDDSINQEKKIPATARTTTIRMQTLIRLTAWPTAELEAQASELDKLFGDLAAALDGESPDIAVAGEASLKVHVAQHEFSGAVWDFLYETAGVGTGAGHSH
jgi:hypothetical protein